MECGPSLADHTVSFTIIAFHCVLINSLLTKYYTILYFTLHATFT